ncbi:MAG: sigma-70 family RNA polymerase sigma factor [Myxococcota bacterium]
MISCTALRSVRQATTPTEPRRLAQHLYVHHSAEVLSFFRITRRIAQADAIDLLHQTFSELLRTLARREDLQIEYPRAFLFKLATRQLYAFLRRRHRQPEFDAQAEPVEIAARDDLEYEVSLRSEQRMVLRAMRRLCDDRRRREPREPDAVSTLQLLVYFRFWLGLPLVEVAEIFEISADAVSSRQRRALQKLQRCLDEIEAEEEVRSTSTTLLMQWRDRLVQEAHMSRFGAHHDSRG